MERIIKGFLLMSAGSAGGVLIIGNIAILSPLLISVGVITSLVLIILGIKMIATSFGQSKANSDKGRAEIPPTENQIGRLPNELLLSIFTYVPPESNWRIEGVCTHWAYLGKDDQLWQSHFTYHLKRVPHSTKSLREEYISYTSLPFLSNLIEDKCNLLAHCDSDPLLSNLAVSPDEETVIWGESDYNRLLVINRHEHHLKTFDSPIVIQRLQYSADGKKIFGFGYQKEGRRPQIVIWNTKLEILAQYDADPKTTSYAISPNANKIFLWDALQENNFCIQDIETKEKMPFDFLQDSENYYLKTAVFSYDEKTILIGFTNLNDSHLSLLELWDLKSKTKLKEFNVNSEISCLAFSQSGDKIVVCGSLDKEEKCTFALYDVVSGNILHESQYDKQNDLIPRSIEFLARDLVIVTEGDNAFDKSYWKNHKLLYVKTGELVHSFEGTFTASWKVKICHEKNDSHNQRQLWSYSKQTPKSETLFQRLFKRKDKYPVFIEDC